MKNISFKYVPCWSIHQCISEGWKIVMVRPLSTTIFHILMEKEDEEKEEKEV